VTRTVAQALDDFVDHTMKSMSPLLTTWLPDWRSPCEYGDMIMSASTEPSIMWRPVRRDDPGVLAPLEAALDATIHPDLKQYWGRYFAASLGAQAPQGPLSLLQLWNGDDSERLIENQIGHVVTQRRAKAPLSLFFACTEDGSDYILTVDNTSGEVLLEAPGRKPLQVVAPNLAAFLDELTPRPSAT
jgi:SecY interacting protein Syd